MGKCPKSIKWLKITFRGPIWVPWKSNRRSTTDPELCSNFSFWSGKDCGPPNFYRCTGSWSGQCGDYGKPFIDYWKIAPNGLREGDFGVASVYADVLPVGEKCIDKSDQFWLLDEEKKAEEWHPKECKTSEGKPGLTCFSAPDQRCLELTKWCNRFNREMEREDIGINAEGRSPQICTEHKKWCWNLIALLYWFCGANIVY